MEAALKAKAEAEAEEERLADIVAEEAIEAQHKANKNHRKKIEGEIFTALKDLTFDPEDADRFISALKENAIPHVTIQY